MTIKEFRNFLYFILIFIPSIFFGQDDNRFYKLGLENGLSQSSVTCAIQDKQGFLWFGTQSGLNKYDGYKFKTYYFNPRDTNSLSESRITSIFEDNDGYLWIGTRHSGLNRFNPRTEEFKRFTNNPSDPNSLSNNTINCIFQDQAGNFWIGTENGLNFFDKKSNAFKRFLKNDMDIKTISSNSVRNIFQDEEGNIWVGTDHAGLNCYIKKENNFTRYYYPDAVSDLKTVKHIFQYQKKMLVISTEDGLRSFDLGRKKFIDLLTDIPDSDIVKHAAIDGTYEETDGKFWCSISQDKFTSSAIACIDLPNKKVNYLFHDKNNANSVSDERILTIIKDRAGIIWLGTNGKGINYFYPKGTKFFHLQKNDSKLDFLSGDYIYSIYEDVDTTVWIGTSECGLNHYNINSKKMEYYKDILLGKRITSIENAGNGNLWIGCNSNVNGSLFLFDKETKQFYPFESKPNSDYYLNDLHITRILKEKNKLWFGTANGGLNVLNLETNKFKHYIHYDQDPYSIIGNEINDIYRDKNGKLWIGSAMGLDLFNESTETFTHFLYNSKDSTSISNNCILCIKQTKNNDFWIGTAFGLNKYDSKTKSFVSYSIKDGLPDNYIYGILEDDAGNLWISTNNGISKFNPKNKTFKNFDVSDGLQSKEFNTHAFHKGNSGLMYFGGINGLNIFHPDSIKENKIIPSLLITSFKIFGNNYFTDTTISYKKHIIINYSQNFLSFEFASVDYLFPEKNEFACKMEGFDKDWIQLGHNHNVSYSNLDPGEYIFRVKGSNNDGIWNNEGTFLKITIRPPFYKTNWFYIVCVLLIIMGAYIFYKLRVRGLLKKQAILEKQVIERTSKIEKQKDEIEAKNKDITDSINYAKRIQNAILASDNYLTKNLPEHLVLYKPKDIISGDFYWVSKTAEGKIFVVTADCTGHGVPGAFMSLIGAAKLDEIILERKISDPAKVLDNLREEIIHSLNPEGSGFESQDGMDVVICCFDFEKMKLNFSCANNPLWLFRENKMIEFKPDKMPIGIYQGKTKPFTLQTLDLEKGDVVYTFTDGYADQFGGEKGKKFKYKHLQEVLQANIHLPMSEQKKNLDNTIENWRGNLEQVDDILVIGIKVD